ncbi:MAG: DNA gyrase modulator, partial [Candidatus Competibacteraceae bacterium]|nr:DNA gyrase modulator [Candidatus Competibacteraceae bacterium]
MFEQVERSFRELAPGVEFCSLRLVYEEHEMLAVCRGVVQPVRRGEDLGAMVTVFSGGALGYAATPDLSPAGLRQALDRALSWAKACAGHALVGLAALEREPRTGCYRGPELSPWE